MAFLQFLKDHTHFLPTGHEFTLKITFPFHEPCCRRVQWENTQTKYTHYAQLPNFQSNGVLMDTPLEQLQVNAMTPNLGLHAHNSTATTVISH
jgi:hypothetical protein